jgi:hypothetical protein
MTTVFSHFYNDLLSTTGRKNWGRVIKRVSVQAKRLREVRQGVLKHGPDCRCHDAFFFNLCSGK